MPWDPDGDPLINTAMWSQELYDSFSWVRELAKDDPEFGKDVVKIVADYFNECSRVFGGFPPK